MKTRTIGLTAIFALSAAAMVMPAPISAGAQTQNQTSKFQITESFTTYRIPEMFTWIIAAGLLGVLLNRLLETWENRLLAWKRL